MHIYYCNPFTEYFVQSNALACTASEKDFNVVFANDYKISKLYRGREGNIEDPRLYYMAAVYI